MYQHSLLVEQLRLDRELELSRRVERARRFRSVTPAGRRRRRSWWPRARRSGLRLAMAGHVPSRRAAKPCVDC